MDDTTPTIFCTRSNRVIDACMGNADTVADRLAALSKAYGPDLVVLAWDDAYARMEEAAKTEPLEISEEFWLEALNALPPMGWRNSSVGESFKMPEPLVGSIVSIYVRLAGRHFTFNDSMRLKHEECCARVALSSAFGYPAEDKPALPLAEPEEGSYGREWPSADGPDEGRW